MKYHIGTYNIGENKNYYNSKVNRIIDYLKGVTLARQLINKIKPEFIEKCIGDIIEIGGFDNYFKDIYSSGKFLNLDIIKTENTDLVMDAECLDSIPNNSIGAFICISVLEHTINPEFIIREMSKKIKKNGKIYLSVPWLFEEHMEPQDFLRFSPYYLESVFKKYGLEVQNKFHANGYWGILAHFSQKKIILRYTIGIVLMLLEMAKKTGSKYTTQSDYILIKV